MNYLRISLLFLFVLFFTDFGKHFRLASFKIIFVYIFVIFIYLFGASDMCYSWTSENNFYELVLCFILWNPESSSVCQAWYKCLCPLSHLSGPCLFLGDRILGSLDWPWTCTISEWPLSPEPPTSTSLVLGLQAWMTTAGLVVGVLYAGKGDSGECGGAYVLCEDTGKIWKQGAAIEGGVERWRSVFSVSQTVLGCIPRVLKSGVVTLKWGSQKWLVEIQRDNIRASVCSLLNVKGES